MSGAALIGCESCGLVSVDVVGDDPTLAQKCARCGHPLYLTKPFALQRTWACVLGAAVLYVPANVLPVMVLASFLTSGSTLARLSTLSSSRTRVRMRVCM